MCAWISLATRSLRKTFVDFAGDKMAETKERKTRLNCPKCDSAALGATQTKVPSSQEYKVYTRAKCLNCGAEFDLVEPQI